MFITKWNRFFEKHGKKTFIAITGIIIVTFVLYFSPGFDFFGLLSQKTREGEILKGSRISSDELNKHIDQALLQMALKYPGIDLGSNQYRQMMANKAIEDIILLNAARERGISVDDASVVNYLKDSQSFKKDGRYNSSEYRAFVEDKLATLKIPVQDLEEAARNELIIKRLENEFKSGILSTPEEIRSAFDTDKEKIKCQVLRFQNFDYLKDLLPNEKETETYYNANRDNYKIPNKYKVQVFYVKYKDYEEEANKKVTEEDIKQYYEAHKNEFKKNNEEQPLEKIKDKIKETLVQDKAKNIASEKAYLLATEAFNAASDKQNKKDLSLAAIKEIAEKYGFISLETTWIRADDTLVPQIGFEPDLVKQFSNLYPDSPVSEAVIGNNGAYLAFLLDTEKERPAEFAEVKKDIEIDWKKEKSISVAREKARESALRLADGLSSGKKIEEIITEPKAEDIKEFTLDSSPRCKDAGVITELAIDTEPGKISEVRDVPDGAIIVYCEKKTKPTDEDFKKQENSFSKLYKDKKEAHIWRLFVDDLMEKFAPKNDEEDDKKKKF